MRIIDPHVHVWKNDPKFPWAKETINPPNNDATPETTKKQASFHCVRVGVPQTTGRQPSHNDATPETRSGKNSSSPSYSLSLG